MMMEVGHTVLDNLYDIQMQPYKLGHGVWVFQNANFQTFRKNIKVLQRWYI